MPVVPARINTALPVPLPFVQFVAVLVEVVLEKVTLVAWVVGAANNVVKPLGLLVAVEVLY